MIGWRDEQGEVHRGSLFAAFAALARGEAWSFPALRPHQREPWHAFTVQVAAMALLRAGRDAPPTDEAAWRDLLIGLTPDYPDGEAWELVVDDWSRPALLQPPTVAPTDRAAYKNRLPTPDALDMLVTAKNHDLKQERMVAANDEDWLFALVTLQTTEGFLGAGNYGISRMNGGFASRMSMSLRPTTGGAAAAFRWDVRRLLAIPHPPVTGGTGLLWTVGWDGTDSLSYNDLAYLYVEICRRVRLVRAGGGRLEALAAASKAPRVAQKGLGGNTEDPWSPLTLDKKKESQTYGLQVSVTATSAGFRYDRISKLLQRSLTTPSPLMAVPGPVMVDAPPLSIVAAALVRGQGKTEGLHRRTIPRQPEPTGKKPPPDDLIGAVATKRAADASTAGGHLRRALISLVQGGPERKKVRFDDSASRKKTDRWIVAFDNIVDTEFFGLPFWAEVNASDENHRYKWRERLLEIASQVFEAAAEAVPYTEVKRIRSRVRSRRFLDGQFHNWLKDARYGE